jgi:hypothetical protein
VHPDSFRYPATMRGYPVARPYLVYLVRRDGSRTPLPLALSGEDATEVAAWLARTCGT